MSITDKNIVELDCMEIRSSFKSTEFITENNNPDTILLKKAFKINVSGYLPLMVLNPINILIEKETSNLPINDSSNHYIGSFASTHYSMTNLLDRFVSSQYDLENINNLSSKYEEYYKNPYMLIEKEDNTSQQKRDMLLFLIVNQIGVDKLTSPCKVHLNKPIKFVLQDMDLHKETFGQSYTYYITEASIDEPLELERISKDKLADLKEYISNIINS